MKWAHFLNDNKRCEIFSFNFVMYHFCRSRKSKVKGEDHRRTNKVNVCKITIVLENTRISISCKTMCNIHVQIWLCWKVTGFTHQPFGLEGYCRHGSGVRAGLCQICGTRISVTALRIFSIRSSMELSRPVAVHCHGHLPICPIWACTWAKKLVKFAINWAQTLRNAYLWNCWMDLPHLKFHGHV